VYVEINPLIDQLVLSNLIQAKSSTLHLTYKDCKVRTRVFRGVAAKIWGAQQFAYSIGTKLGKEKEGKTICIPPL